MSDGVVITGLGVVTGLGVGVASLWEGLTAGRSAIGPIRSFPVDGSISKLGSEAGPLDVKEHVPKTYRKAIKVMARDTQLAVVAASLAIKDAGLSTRAGSEAPTYPGERFGCHIGAGLIAAEIDELSPALAAARQEGGDGEFDFNVWGNKAISSLPPLWMLKYLPNMLACHVTIVHGAEGPSNTMTCAEASGLLSVSESSRVIRRGDADVCLAGGAESKLNLMGHLRMELAGRLAEVGEGVDGSSVIRPYDPDAAGGVQGEAGGLIVLERTSQAAARGARAYAEVIGVGAGHSGPPLLPPFGDLDDDVSDEGLEVAIEAALEAAGIGPEDIDAIVPHGSGIRAIDQMEAGALRSVFGDRLASIELVTLAGHIGECMAGAGGVATAVGALCLHEQRLPARLHAGEPAHGLLAGARASREASLSHVLVCTNALGGQNAAVVLRGVGR